MKKLRMYPNTSAGLLIVFCGLDGSGKTTLLTRLTDDLKKDRRVFLTKQPTENVRQTNIFRTYMDDPDHDDYDYRSLSLLAASDRIQHTNKTILPRLEAGNIVISDRYFFSCLANLRARGYKKDKWIYDVAKSIIKPDIAFFCDASVETAVGRVRRREEEKDRYIDMELQYKLFDEYKGICKANNGVAVPTDKLSVEESYDIVKNCVERKLENEC